MFFVEGLSFCAQRRCSNPPPASALAYFKYVPLFIALPLLLVLFLAYRVYQSTAENKPMALVKTLGTLLKTAAHRHWSVSELEDALTKACLGGATVPTATPFPS